MALESISAAGNSITYTDVVKNVTKAPQTQVKAAERQESAKKATASAQTVRANGIVSAEMKPTAAEAQKKEETVSSKIKDAVDKVNQKIVPSKTRCEFSYHEDTNRISIKVIDQSTNETIKEIPAEETLDMLSKIWEFAGLMVDEKR